MDANWTHPPKIIQWDTTSSCNLNCRHCRASNLDRNDRDLSFAEAVDMLNQVDQMAPGAALAMAGGEPLMRDDLIALMDHIKTNLSLSIELLTNATLITKNNEEELCRYVDGFNISMEGSTAEVHDPVRGKGSFARTLSAVDLLTARGVPLAIRMTYFGQGKDEVERLLVMIKEHGVTTFNFRYVVPVGNATGAISDPLEHRDVSRFVWEKGNELGLTVGFSDPFPELLVNPERLNEVESDQELFSGVAVTGCSVAFSLMYINPQGVVQFCPYFPVVVDRIQNRPLKDIWFENEKFNTFRYSRSFLNGQCGECRYKFACGGCRGAAYATGDYLGSDPRCWLTQEEARQLQDTLSTKGMEKQ
ncbi:radical SAM/SPASM domain-containing protein [Desulfoluna spongiiphila]|uniref:radical SAM/SPASM domain-containing protein n=1 Tax=Desulfoluna spongiiphila TaxID=419481 RepID=UPI001252DEB2|nr:radical SAM protein [Desulfoluna spongiiphila]VVS93752.1 aldolase-type tim barrel [Desulfoluna spongiiphila]